MRMKSIAGFIFCFLLLAGSGRAQEKPLTLEESIRIILDRNLQLHSAIIGIEGSEFRRKEAITNFLPSWTGQYVYTRNNTPQTIGSTTGTTIFGPTTIPLTSRDVYNFNTTVSQPLFTGGANLANYYLAKIGVDLSQVTVETTRLDLVLQARTGYFNILSTEKLLIVAEQQVKQFEAQLAVTKAFFDVGIVPKNDVLQAEVQLANARQGQVTAANNVATAKAVFNNLLRREINTPVELVDILGYQPFPTGFESSLEEALRRRPEIKAAELTIDQAKEGVKLARAEFFPTISLLGNYSRTSEEATTYGDIRTERWSVQALATFTLWNWGNTAFKVGENKVKVTQAEDVKIQLVEAIVLEVKNDYLSMQVAEKNINVAEKAIEQAEENLRMNEERYKYQVATQTDVLNAVTLLTQARTNYYSALSGFNIAKAQLERSMGRMYP